MSEDNLHQLLDHAAVVHPCGIAVEESGPDTITYRDLAMLSDLLRDRLSYLGVQRGDRVGIYLPKSIEAVAAIFGILKVGAAYVPVDTGAPAARNAYILSDCSVKVVLVERLFEERLRAELAERDTLPYLLILEGTGGGRHLREALAREHEYEHATTVATATPAPDDLAYILYTSGSTGRPKGVMLSHRNAISFVDWCSEVFAPQPHDRFSSHAPFHFDLSIFDLYVSIKHGAALVLIAEEIGKDPIRLAPLIAEKRISIWYSTPSVLSLLAQYGKMTRHDYSALRLVLFAGEVFPVKHLRTLQALLPGPRYFNLYGPTETNVCTYYEIPARIAREQVAPFPIGRACADFRIKVVDEHGQAVPSGEEGELVASGPAVMQGYWNLPEHTASAFLLDPSGRRWYRTRDLVIEDADGSYLFIGRRDRMVKKRGYRVELGEIEACLYRHPAVKEAAVIALPDEDSGVRVKAFLSLRDGERASIIELKRFCVENLPAYMTPDLFSFVDALPKTSTDKIDYQRLQESERWISP